VGKNLSSVWLFRDVPSQVKKRLNLSTVDYGIHIKSEMRVRLGDL
jgi:hypothetical protein